MVSLFTLFLWLRGLHLHDLAARRCATSTAGFNWPPSSDSLWRTIFSTHIHFNLWSRPWGVVRLWVFTEFLQAPIPRKGSDSTTTGLSQKRRINFFHACHSFKNAPKLELLENWIFSGFEHISAFFNCRNVQWIEVSRNPAQRCN